MKLIPVNEQLLVKPDRIVTHEGGLEIPEMSRRKPTTGTIVRSATTKFDPGQRILFGQFAPLELEVTDDTIEGVVWMIHPKDVYAILEGDPVAPDPSQGNE